VLGGVIGGVLVFAAAAMAFTFVRRRAPKLRDVDAFAGVVGDAGFDDQFSRSGSDPGDEVFSPSVSVVGVVEVLLVE
jgi:hypothetical protein